jgi:hypothetical protein
MMRKLALGESLAEPDKTIHGIEPLPDPSLQISRTQQIALHKRKN